MLRRSARMALAALAIAFWPLGSMQVALAAAGGPGSGPPTCQAQPFGFGADLGTSVNAGFQADLPPTVDSIAAASPLIGFPTWTFLLGNNSGVPVTNPTITVNSGYSASVFGGSLPTPGLPSSCGLPGLASGQTMFFPQLQANVPVTSTLGFDSTRSVSPLVLPVGGGQQTVTMTVTLQDQRYATGNNLQVNIGVGPGDAVVSTTPPKNLNQGESLNANPGQATWFMSQAVIGKQYTFSAVVNYANPFNYPWTHPPDVLVTAATINGQLCNPCNVPGPTVTVPVPSLDGGVSGAGTATFAVNETGHLWRGGVSYIYVSHYTQFQPDTTPPVIAVPASITVNATSPAGAAVNYVVSATDPDNLSSQLTMTCSPVSGSTFAIGVTTVNCSASDPAGNTANASFTVTVLGPGAQLNNLVALTQNLHLQNGISTSLDAKLNAAIATLADMKNNSVSTACNQLSAFINHTTAQSGNKLTVSQANQLIAAAQQIRATLGC